MLFTVFGSVGVALAHWQPRFALFGAVTTTLSLLFGVTVVSSGTATPSCLDWVQRDQRHGRRNHRSAGDRQLGDLRVAGDGAARRGRWDRAVPRRRDRRSGPLDRPGDTRIVDHDVDIGSRVYAILATVYVVGTAVLLVLRLLPPAEDSCAPIRSRFNCAPPGSTVFSPTFDVLRRSAGRASRDLRPRG